MKDLISCMMHRASRNDGVSIYNFCHEHRYTISEICSTFAKVAGYNQPHLTIPVWFMNFAVLPFEMLHAVGIKTGINRDIKKLWFSSKIYFRSG